MRIPTRWLAAFMTFGLVSTVIVAGADSRRDAARAAPGASLALENGVTISPRCEPVDSASGVQHIAFSAMPSHKFLGFGVNFQTSKAAEDIPRTVADIRKLGFVWVRTNLGQGDTSADGPGSEAGLQVAGVNVPKAHSQLYAALQAAGIKIVVWLPHPPADYFNSGRRAQNGKPGRFVKQDAIPALAQYYADYLRSLAKLGVRPDLVELINEPNLAQNGKYKPIEYAQLLANVERDLAAGRIGANLSGPGTAARISHSARFVEAMQAQGAISGLKAISIHTYYVRDNANNPDVPPADDPDFQTLVTAARNAGIPLISTEFGGTDIKTKQIDPSNESVDTAEEFKAALDLVRAGESAAIVWNLYPNYNLGGLLKTWALIDSNGPTNAYWPFYILSRKVPVGADVLAIEKTDVAPAFTALGYAAFRSGRHVYVGLSNPARTSAATVALDLSRLGPFNIVHAASFLPTRAVEQDASMRPGTCPLTVSIPSGTGMVLDIDELH